MSKLKETLHHEDLSQEIEHEHQALKLRPFTADTDKMLCITDQRSVLTPSELGGNMLFGGADFSRTSRFVHNG